MTARPFALVLALVASSLADCALAAPGVIQGPAPAPASPETRLGFSLGADAGLGGETSLTFDRFAAGLPVAARITVGYRSLDPGDPLAARHVFINNNTNGTPAKTGRRWDYRLDAVWQPGWARNLWLTCGPRYSSFAGEFDFVGGNEFFAVHTRQWGLGSGAESRFPVGRRALLVLGAGLDYYARATFLGHDTSYSPDGSAVNPHEEYTYADADAAINQPRWAPRLTMGVEYPLGR
jgi:hypothetical protein